MKKTYLYPQTECYAAGLCSALCVSPANVPPGGEAKTDFE